MRATVSLGFCPATATRPLTLIACLLAPAAAPAEGGGYIGAGAGLSLYSEAGIVGDACRAYGVDCPADDSDLGLKAFAGYQFGDYVALEGGYVSLGKTTADLPETIRVSTEVRGVTLGLKPRIPLGERAAVFGKAGIFAWHTDLNAESESLGINASGDGAGTDATFGAGVSYRLNEHASFQLEWDRYMIDEDVDADGTSVEIGTDIDLFSASFALHFR